jgi:hypothetical protein
MQQCMTHAKTFSGIAEQQGRRMANIQIVHCIGLQHLGCSARHWCELALHQVPAFS